MTRDPDSRIGARHIAYGLFVACTLACLGWPGYPALADKIEPFILGLPFSLAWNVGWVLLSFLALSLFYLADHGGR